MEACGDGIGCGICTAEAQGTEPKVAGGVVRIEVGGDGIEPHNGAAEG